MFKKLTTREGQTVAVNLDHVQHIRDFGQMAPVNARSEIVFMATAVELVGTSSGGTNEFMPANLIVRETIDEILS